MNTHTDRTLFQLSYPLFLHSLVMFAVMVLDMMIWSAHGPETAAALSVAGQVLRVAVELSTIIGIGAVIVMSQQLGRGDTVAARLTAEVACVANGAVGLVLGAGLALAGPLILRLMGLGEGIEAQAALYLRLAGAAMAFLSFGNTAVACLRGFGRSRTVMLLGVTGAAFYLALEYMLVLGVGPVPPLGVGGAGLANLAMRVTVALVLAAVLARALGLHLRLRAAWSNRAQVRHFALLATPSVSDFIAYSFYQMIVLGLIASHGEVAVLTRAYVMIAMAFLTLVIMAVCQGSEVLIGYRLGAGDRVAAHAQGLRSAWIASALSAACAAAIWVASGPFIGLFTADPAVHDLSRRLLFLTIFLQPCFSVNMILFHALRAAEDVRWPVLVSQGVTWGLGLPLAWFLSGPAGYGIEGIWYAFIAEELVKSVAMYWRWTTGRAAQMAR